MRGWLFCEIILRPHWQSSSIDNGQGWHGPRSTPKCKPYIVSIFVVCHPVVLSKNSNMTVISVVKTLVHIWSTLVHIEDSSWIDRQYQPCESLRRNWFRFILKVQSPCAGTTKINDLAYILTQTSVILCRKGFTKVSSLARHSCYLGYWKFVKIGYV